MNLWPLPFQFGIYNFDHTSNSSYSCIVDRSNLEPLSTNPSVKKV